MTQIQEAPKRQEERPAGSKVALRVLAGLNLRGATLVQRDGVPAGANIGQVTWGPAQLLRDLELRLGLFVKAEAQAVRIARWQTRMAQLSPLARYYSPSFEVDPLGTAEAVLRLRDSLVAAGWEGEAIPGGGRRLDALHELEQLLGIPLPAGMADRLVAVVQALAESPASPYTELSLLESIELWPARWQRLFRLLEERGMKLRRFGVTLPGAPPDSDLGKVQAALASPAGSPPATLHGDGSLVMITAETTWEAARASAAVLARLPVERTVVIREHETSALDGALQAHGSRTQGLSSLSASRSALQVLPLALELAFEPKDPYRVLELLTLPVGPFQGRAGHSLAKALAQSPGIGSPTWEGAKAWISGNEEAPARAAQHLEVIGAWLEEAGADRVVGAPKPILLAVVERARAWLLARIASAPDDATLLTAAHHASALGAALQSDPREILNLVEIRKLVGSVLSTGTAVELIPEQAGRIDHVASANCLWAARDVVVWWPFTNQGTPAARLPWRRPEIIALRQAGIHFPDPAALLAEEVQGARRAFHCATQRVVLVSAAESAGTSLASHPLWDEIVTRAGLTEAALSRIVVNTRQLLEPASPLKALAPLPLTAQPELRLPGGQLEWTVPGCEVEPLEQFSPASLDALLGCPLRWVLRYRAGTYSAGHALPPLVQLNGSLGHRLVETLHQQAAFELSDDTLREAAQRVLDELFQREGALLLRPGMTFERSQFTRQLLDSIVDLGRMLREARLRIAAVEQPIDVAWKGGKLTGRIDLLVVGDDGATGIIDLKWGMASYRKQLASGQALQLALYAFAHAVERDASVLPDAAYFSLKQGKLFGHASGVLPNVQVISGPSLSDTWARVERSLDPAARLIHARRFPATGLRRSLPLLTTLGIGETEHAAHFAHEPEQSCKYCGFGSLCGRRWEVLQ